MGEQVKWNGREREVSIGSAVCVARVLILVESIETQLRVLSPRFRWRSGYELHVAVVADGETDVVVGYVLSQGDRVGRPMLAYEDAALRAKLVAAAQEQGRRQMVPGTVAGGRVRSIRYL